MRDLAKSRTQVFSARCNIYISRLCYDVSVRLSVRLSVTEVYWRIIANLGLKFRTQYTAHCGRRAARRAACGGTPRAMLASSCYLFLRLGVRVSIVKFHNCHLSRKSRTASYLAMRHILHDTGQH